MPSGRPKGGTNKYWTAKEKEKILLELKKKELAELELLKNMEYLELNISIGLKHI